MLTGKQLGQAIAQAIALKKASGAIKREADVALHFGVKQPSLADWKQRGTISKEKLPELWRYFSDVVGPEHWGLKEFSASLEPAPGIIGRVPLVSWVQAGEYVEAVERWDADEWIETSAPIRPHTFALRVKGDSMEPTFPDGVVIIIEPDLEANPGDFVVARNGGNEATFKQLVRDGADLYLKPLNERYPIKPLGSSHIVGVVREMIKKFR